MLVPHSPMALRAFFSALSNDQLTQLQAPMATDLLMASLLPEAAKVAAWPLDFCRSLQVPAFSSVFLRRESRFIKTCEDDRKLQKQLKQALINPLSSFFRPSAKVETLSTPMAAVLRGLGNDLLADTWPWLGVAMPPEIETEELTARIVDLVAGLYGPKTRCLVLHSAGRSSWPDFAVQESPASQERVVVVLAQASLIKTAEAQKILLHFGLGRNVSHPEWTKGQIDFCAKGGMNRLIGLAQDPMDLAGYHTRDVSSRFLGEIPRCRTWKDSMVKAIEQDGGIDLLSRKSGLKRDLLNQFSMGQLATGIEEVIALEGVLGGVENALELWVSCWEEVIDDALFEDRTISTSWHHFLRWRAALADEKIHMLESLLESAFVNKTSPRLGRRSLEKRERKPETPDRRPKSRVDLDRFAASLEKAVSEAEASFGENPKKPSSMTQVSDRACLIYNQDLPLEKHLDQMFFRNKVLTYSIPERSRLILLGTQAIQKWHHDRSRKDECYDQALREAEEAFARERTPWSLSRFCKLVHDIYNRGLSSEKQNGIGVFTNELSGPSHIPELRERVFEFLKRTK